MPAGKDSDAEGGAKGVGAIAAGEGGEAQGAEGAMSRRKEWISAGKLRTNGSTQKHGKISRRRIECAASHRLKCTRSRERLRSFHDLASRSALDHLAALAVVTAITTVAETAEVRRERRANSWLKLRGEAENEVEACLGGRFRVGV